MEYTSEQLRLLTDVLPSVAAQLRAPLTELRSAIPSDEDEAADPAIETMTRCYYQMMRTVTNLTDAPLLAEQEPLEKQNTEMVEWLDTLCRQAEVPLELCGISLTMHTALRSHVAGIHRVYTQRAFWNLLSNAAKFTPAGGQIDVSLALQGRSLILTISDTGRGIDEHLQETVFDRFLHTGRMDPAPHGLGLGLPLSRAIITRQGGRLLLSPRPGGGTAATVSLPAARLPQAQAPVRQMPFDYAGGFQSVLMELSDRLPREAFAPKYLD